MDQNYQKCPALPKDAQNRGSLKHKVWELAHRCGRRHSLPFWSFYDQVALEWLGWGAGSDTNHPPPLAIIHLTSDVPCGRCGPFLPYCSPESTAGNSNLRSD